MVTAENLGILNHHPDPDNDEVLSGYTGSSTRETILIFCRVVIWPT